MNGELMLALAYGLVLMLSGVWIARRVRRDYRDPSDNDEI
jgi:hypothetical protein|tara:strand:- start:488 stop:607 length:120 start_codon:yes stop_codon:yes gene_type:complete